MLLQGHVPSFDFLVTSISSIRRVALYNVCMTIMINTALAGLHQGLLSAQQRYTMNIKMMLVGTSDRYSYRQITDLPVGKVLTNSYPDV